MCSVRLTNVNTLMSVNLRYCLITQQRPLLSFKNQELVPVVQKYLGFY